MGKLNKLATVTVTHFPHEEDDYSYIVGWKVIAKDGEVLGIGTWPDDTEVCLTDFGYFDFVTAFVGRSAGLSLKYLGGGATWSDDESQESWEVSA